MRMARAFIASVPLAVVLVAALVVPLTVIPGTFGFESWPTSPGGKVTESQVEVASPSTRTQVARNAPLAPATGRRSLASLPVAQKPNKVTTRPTAGSTPARTRTRAPQGHHAPAVVRSPSAGGPGRGPSSPHHNASSTPSTPAAPPQQPQPQPQPAPSNVPAPGTVASGAPPIAREDPAAAPPPPPPVETFVPDEPQQPQAPDPGPPPCNQGQYQGHGHGHGHGLGLGLGLDRGHGHGHGSNDD